MTRPFQLQGHRGARGLFPENTIEGFRSAMALGMRCFELDVGVLRDGVVVVHHDLALNPDIASLDGRWLSGSLPLLKTFDLEELNDFDVGRIRPGADYATRHPHQVPCNGARIPTLATVLALDARLTWNIELKLMPDRPDWTVPPEEMVERVLAVVDAADAAARVTVQSFDWRAPRHARRIRPEIARGWLTRAETVADPELWLGRTLPGSIPEAIAEEGGGTWTPYWEELTPDLLHEAHALGLQVIPWTVNDPAHMARLMQWGVDGLITDRPDLAPPLA
jgi:glycerophosphoryl diester phosphodiesterase